MEHDYYEGSETLSEDIINCESDEEGADEYDEDNRIQAADSDELFGDDDVEEEGGGGEEDGPSQEIEELRSSFSSFDDSQDEIDQQCKDSSPYFGRQLATTSISSPSARGPAPSNADWVQQHFLLSKDSSGGGSSGGGGNSRHASNQISSVGSSQTTHDPLEDTVIFNGFTKKKRKGQNDNNTKRGGLGLNKLWRTALAQEESDRNLRQHFMCDTKQTSSVRVIVKSRSVMLNKSLVKLTCETTQLSPLLSQTQAKNQRFQMLFNPEHFKMGDFDTVMKSTTLDVFKPWNEYKLKEDELLIFNPSKVKNADLPHAEPASTEMAQ